MSNQDNEHRFGFGQDIDTLDIDEDGAMVINNVTIDHISLYTLIYNDIDGHEYQHEFIIIDCPVTVYAHRGSDALINCYFPQSQRIFWYDSTSRNARPIISLEEGRKAGPGVSAGNIRYYNRRSVDKEYYFQRRKNIPCYSYSNIDTAVFSVDVCEGSNFCLVHLQDPALLTCRETNTGPHTLLSWTRNTSNDTRLVNTSKPFDGNMYEAFVTTNVNLNSTDRLFVYICNSMIDIPAKPLRQIVVMVEDESKDSITTLLKPTYYREYDDVRLVCNNENPLFILWKRNYETIGYYHEGKSDVLKPGYQLDKDGSLLINKFSYVHEGEYVCIYNNGRDEGVKQHNIKTVDIEERCLLRNKPLSYIMLINRQPQLIVRNVGYLFNIYLTTYYEITTNQGYESETDEDWKAYDITASCSVNYEILGQHKTVVTLHLQKRSPALTEDRIIERFETNMNWQCVIPVSVMSVIIIIFIIIIIIIVFAKWHNGKAG
ncbi:hypothetical protein BSL78_08264 [Apostichopus japonicus]|uniref:Ig-like domain-containing protein n=1 Tax=Stichopus japonicus TaxID=307972 RepID=A0A2G8L3Q7_STIJA|nr:hypothetical protein BSL78_08264 [Apostichopus japonicus]